MNEFGDAEARLSRIETMWSVVGRAHGDNDAEARIAQRQMLEQYGGAIRRYLIGAVRNPVLAEDLYQGFSLRFLEGRLGAVDPAKGRFRSYVKTVLFRMVAEHHRRTTKRREQVLSDADPIAEGSTSDNSAEADRFVDSWRADLLSQAWSRLEDFQAASGRPLHTVLKIRTEHPKASSEELAQQLSNAIGKTVRPGNARVLLHRARDKFARLLIELVIQSLPSPDRSSVEDELSELRMMKYCKGTLDEMRWD